MTLERPRHELPKILVVDDSAANRVAMSRLLAKVAAEVIEAKEGNAALAACLDHDFALILLDVHMPGMDGFEVAALLGEEVSTRDIPIMFVTAGFTDDLKQLRGYGSGAVDFIAKPINDVILLSKVQVFLDLYLSKLALKAALEELSERNRQLQAEIAERLRAESAARHQATHDVLTELPNRTLFIDRLQTAVDRARQLSTPLALAYIDIDKFKPVNDEHGHHAGDLLLTLIGQRLRSSVRREDTVARLGGDEFAIIMEGLSDTSAAVLRLCESLCGELRRAYLLEVDGRSVEVTIGTSLGIAFFPRSGNDCDALIRAADRAMYRAKREGRDRCVVSD